MISWHVVFHFMELLCKYVPELCDVTSAFAPPRPRPYPPSATQTSGELQDYLSRSDRGQLHLGVTAPSRDRVERGEG